MAIKIIPDNCFFKVYDAQEIDGVPMVYIPVYKKSMNLASVGSGFILPRETPIGPIYLSTISLVLMVMNLKELIAERSRENSTSTITLLTPRKYDI